MRNRDWKTSWRVGLVFGLSLLSTTVVQANLDPYLWIAFGAQIENAGTSAVVIDKISIDWYTDFGGHGEVHGGNSFPPGTRTYDPFDGSSFDGVWQNWLDPAHVYYGYYVVTVTPHNMKPLVLDGWTGGGFNQCYYAYFSFNLDGLPTNTPDDVVVGDPYNVIDGSVERDATDLTLPAVGGLISFGRHYSSRCSDVLSVGRGWSSTIDWKITPCDDGSLRLRNDKGRVFVFRNTGSGWLCDVDMRGAISAASEGGWVLDGRNGGARMWFNSNGFWAASDDGWSNRLTVCRDATGRATNLYHECGASVAISWSNDLIQSVSASDSGLCASYYYNTSNLTLTSVVVTAANGQEIATQFAYEPWSGLLTNVIDARRESVSYQYAALADGTKRCSSSVFGDGSLAANATWDITNQFTTVDFPVLESVTQRVVFCYGSVSNRISSVWAGDGRHDTAYSPLTYAPVSQTWSNDAGVATSLRTLDRLARPIIESRTYNGNLGHFWSTQWDPVLDLVTSSTDPMGWQIQYSWTNGLLATARVGGQSGWLNTCLTYSQGMPTAISDPMCRTNYFQYDNRGNIARVIPPAGPTIALTNDNMGNIVAMTLPHQSGQTRTWTFNRDGFGNVTNAVAPDGISAQSMYDAGGNLTGMVDRAGRLLSITYGAASTPMAVGRTVWANGSNRTVTLVTSHNLQMDATAIIDPLGRKVEAYVRDSAGRITTITNIEGRTASIQYGPADLPVSAVRFDGTTNVFSYNGDWLVTSSVLPQRTNHFTWLANGLLSSIANEMASVVNTWIAPGWLASQETRSANWIDHVDYAYDYSGSITQVTANAINLMRQHQFDPGGRETNRIQICNGVSLTSSREYGTWNGLPTTIRIGSVQQMLGWDVLDQLTNLTWSAGGSSVRQIAFQRNVLGMITQRVDIVNGSVTTVRTYTYDGLDRLSEEEHDTGYHAQYEFDDAGRRIAKTTGSFAVNYTNSAGDRLAGWSVSRTSLTVAVAGMASKPIGTNAQFGLWRVHNGAGAATPIINGSNFMATLPAEALGTQTVVALISDMAGNVGLTTNRSVLTAYTTGSYVGDAAGCVTQIVYQGPLCQQTKALGWDVEYRLTGVSTNGVPAESYGYDPTGRRITTTTADGAIIRHMQDGQHLLADLNAAGGVLRSYFHGPNTDELLAMTVHTGTVPRTYYSIRDHQNTIWAWVDTNGAVVETYDYDAWGRLLSVVDANGHSLATSAIGNRFLFQGREYSWATGLYYFRARWYDPVSGRWLSNDPIGINGGLNLYAFCANNPVNYIDPLGTVGFWSGVGSVAGKIWNLPNTAVGVTVGMVGMGISQLPGLPGGSVHFRHNAIEFENNPLMFAGAITLGNTINYKGCESKQTFGPFAELDNGYVWQHEIQHTFQGEVLGPLYLPANIFGAAGGYLSEGDYHGSGNFMESGPSAWPPRMWP